MPRQPCSPAKAAEPGRLSGVLDNSGFGCFCLMYNRVFAEFTFPVRSGVPSFCLDSRFFEGVWLRLNRSPGKMWPASGGGIAAKRPGEPQVYIVPF